jgi:DNA-binding MarR family transcriptional regulator
MATQPRPRRARPGLTPEQEQTWFAYMRVALRLNFELNRGLGASSNLSHSDFHVLNALVDSPDQHLLISDLAVRIGWERSRLSHQVLRMEKRNLVLRRTADADARATDVVLAPGGRDALRAATPQHAELVKRLFFDGLDPALLRPLHDSLDQIHEQIVAEGSLPRPPGQQTRWAD